MLLGSSGSFGGSLGRTWSFMPKNKKIIPLFDALNKKVEESLPPLPSGSTQFDTDAIGSDVSLNGPSGYEVHGRRLDIEVSPNRAGEDISGYYHSMLLKVVG